MGAFAERVRSRFRVSPSELAFLDRLEIHPQPFRRGHVLVRAGDPSDQAFVLMAGWAMSYTSFPDGTHQVRRLHFPGDLLAMPSIPMRQHAEDIEALSDAVVASFPKSLLAGLFKLPRLAAIMYMFAQAERITSGDRLACLGHISAKGRVAFLLVDILQRLRAGDPSVGRSFHMHLTREQVAQVTGMTPVHASRMWSALIADGLISCDAKTVTVLDEARLRELAQCTRGPDDFDRDWLQLVEDEHGHRAGIEDAYA
jgi:CRP-like cAMP-binding protein